MLIKKPPIIVILGHIDHGKTTLLDFIRRSNISASEAGGITQKIGAYEIEYKGEKMTFIDTPGHAAFNTLRERGVKVADLAVLIIAADEGIKPQTQESLDYLRSVKIPFVIALNKIDRKEADSSKVISQLIEIDVLPEKFGGSIPLVEISALKGIGVDELLEILILLRDLNDFKVDDEKNGQGFILESFKDIKRGILASAIVVEGRVKTGNYLVTSNAFCKIKIFEDDLGKKIEKALPSKPFLVGNFDQLPLVGDLFFVCSLEEIEKKREEIKSKSQKNYLEIFNFQNVINGEVLNLVLKADSIGSLEALAKIFNKIAVENNLNLKFIKVDVGSLTLEDVYLAKDLKALLINFNLKISKVVWEMIKNFNLILFNADVIYDLEKSFLDYISSRQMQSNLNISQLEVLAVFSASKNKKTIGGQVIKGNLKIGQKLFLKRGEEKIGQLKILSLERNKIPVNEVKEGEICGLVIEFLGEIQVGDFISSAP